MKSNSWTFWETDQFEHFWEIVIKIGIAFGIILVLIGMSIQIGAIQIGVI
jgi:hypothetical protein